jgi:hypothetical protein
MNIRLKIFAGFVAAILLMNAGAALAQTQQNTRTVNGFWEQIDPGSGEVGGWFLMYERDGQFQGALVRAFNKPGEPVFATCAKCPDDQKNAPMIGLVIIKNMQRRGLQYENGNILDPRDGSIYKAKMEMSPDGQKLNVRGFLGLEIFGQTQTWRRLPDTAMQVSEVPQQLQAYVPTGADAKPPTGTKPPTGAKPPAGAKTQSMGPPQPAAQQPRRQQP